MLLRIGLWNAVEFSLNVAKVENLRILMIAYTLLGSH